MIDKTVARTWLAKVIAALGWAETMSLLTELCHEQAEKREHENTAALYTLEDRLTDARSVARRKGL